MSNLLDKSSIVLTPTAYDNGKVLCVKPSDGSGDFDFSRNSAATRVNAQGLVEDVQILSSNLVQNGSFSQIGSEEITNGNFSQEGANIITPIANSDFSSDTGFWTRELNITIGGGLLSFSSSPNNNSFYKTGLIVVGKIYKVEITISNYSEGFIDSNNGNSFAFPASNGTHTIYFVGGNPALVFSANGTTTLDVDNLSVVEVGQDWTFGTGWSVGEDKAVCDGTQTGGTSLYQSALQQNKSYKITFSITSITAGGVGVVNSPKYTTTGTFTYYYNVTGTDSNLYVNANTDFIGSITNISVKEVGQNWDLGTGWSIGDNKLVREIAVSGSYAQTSYDLGIIGNNYQISIDVAEVTSGILYVYGGLGGTPAISITSAGVYKINHIWASDQPLGIFCNNSFVGKVNSISIIEITNDTNLPRINYEGFSYQDVLGSEEIVNGDFSTNTWWTVGQFWSIANGFVTRAVVGSELNYSVSRSNLLTIGKSYKVEIDINSVDSGSVRVVLGSTNGAQYTSAGVYIFEGVCTSSTNFKISPSNDFNGSIDNVSVKEVLGQEVVPDSGCGSWLFEPQSTNLITYSEDFSNASWAKSSTTVVDDASTSPDGTINASSIEIASGGYMYFTHSATINIGDKWTWSCFVKSSDQKITWGGGTPDGTDVYSIETLSNGWYRHILQRTFTASGTNIQPMFSEAVAGTDLFYIYGSQLETLSYSTSYIPTDGTQKTRNRDVCTNGGTGTGLINSTEGVLYFEGRALANDGTYRSLTISDGTDTNRVSLSYTPTINTLSAFVRNTGGAVFSVTTTLIDSSTISKYAIKYKENDFALWVNGVKVATDTSGTTFNSNTLDSLSFDKGNGGDSFYGNTKALAVWKEALTDLELQELTTI